MKNSKIVTRRQAAGRVHLKRFLLTFMMFLGIFIVMAVGYHLIEGFSVYQSWLAFTSNLAADWFEGSEAVIGIPAQSMYGRLFSTFAALATVIVGGYFISVLTSFIVDGQLKEYLKISSMDKQISELKDHFIVTGADDTTREIIEELRKLGKDVVIVYKDREEIEKMGQDALYLDVDPTEDQSMIEAGIKRAKGFVASLDSDQENLYQVMAARSLNPDLKIIAKVFDDNTNANKLKKAGANEVVSPFNIGGLRIASLLARPTVVTFLDKMIKQSGTKRFEEVIIGDKSPLVGRKLIDSQIYKKTGLRVIATQRKDSQEFDYNLPTDYQIEAGDVLVVIGEPEQVEKLEDM